MRYILMRRCCEGGGGLGALDDPLVEGHSRPEDNAINRADIFKVCDSSRMSHRI